MSPSGYIETPIHNPMVRGQMFGFTFQEREMHEPLVHMYIEDDGLWHYKCSFSCAWLSDLLNTVKITVAAAGVLSYATNLQELPGGVDASVQETP